MISEERWPELYRGMLCVLYEVLHHMFPMTQLKSDPIRVGDATCISWNNHVEQMTVLPTGDEVHTLYFSLHSSRLVTHDCPDVFYMLIM